MSDLTRLTVNLTPRAAAALDRAAELSGDNRTDTINRALSVYAWIEGVRADGGAIYVRQAGDTEVKQLVIF